MATVELKNNIHITSIVNGVVLESEVKKNQNSNCEYYL